MWLIDVVSSAAMRLIELGNEKFFSQFGFYVEETNFPKIVDYMHQPKDSSSLAVTRILFGLAMLFDISNERGGARMEERWGNPNLCHFPLFPFLQAIPMPYMAIIYAGLWLGAIGMMLGYSYRISAATFTLCYWYLFLIEKSYWNNHSYLFGLVALLLTFTEANCYWSIDVYRNPSEISTTVPYWNYFILKYQFFILYFMAGLKKGSTEWLSGFAMRNLSDHWVFEPFKLFLSVPQIDFYIVHWFIFIFDLTVAMWMMYSKSRHVAMVFCALFHIMNSRLFRIGMFPWVCLATMPLFYPFDWPKVILQKYESYLIQIRLGINAIFAEEEHEDNLDTEGDDDIVNDAVFADQFNNNEQPEDSAEEDIVFSDAENVEEIKDENDANAKTSNNNNETSYSRKKMTLYLILFHVITQAFLPYSHFITKGYNNWTNGLYGYSWDMMVHNWQIFAVTIKVVNNDNLNELYLDPYISSPNARWIKHGDMVHQYARCLRDKIVGNAKIMLSSERIPQNLSIYVDVWCSLNDRVTQRHFDSKADILKAEWSPFRTPSFVMPLLNESLLWRQRTNEIKNHVLSWNNKSDVAFLADFPGYEHQQLIATDLRNASLTVLDGVVVYQQQVTDLYNGHSYRLTGGDHVTLDFGTYHTVYNIGDKPAYYMYTYYNDTASVTHTASASKLPILQELRSRLYEMLFFVKILVKNLVSIFFLDCNCE